MANQTQTTRIDPIQRELIENAQRRIRQKKGLTRHLVIFIAGSLIFILLDLILGFGSEFQPFNVHWFVWAILIWTFFLIIHFINVVVVNQLMDSKWEERQLERMVERQQLRIQRIREKVEKEYPLPEKKSGLDGPLDPKNPINT